MLGLRAGLCFAAIFEYALEVRDQVPGEDLGNPNVISREQTGSWQRASPAEAGT